MSTIFQICILSLILASFSSVAGSRLTRAVMMSVAPSVNYNCSDLTITEKNSSSHVIVTGTVSTCGLPQAGSYRCTLQIWRVMKGKELTLDLVSESDYSISTPYQKLYVDVYGLGNSIYCESNIKDHDTRIFFLNRLNNRLVLSASLLRITLSNLQNTQAVIEGQKIIEIPKKPYDPCLNILCGYGAHCEMTDGQAYCVCPDFLCNSVEEGEELNAPLCGSDGITYPNECKLKDAQCMAQKRIKVSSRAPCELDCDGTDRGLEACKVSTTSPTRATTTAPIASIQVCKSDYCAFSADCVLGPDMMPRCECPTCDGAEIEPVCGSDQRSYSSACALRRTSCSETRNISIVRHAACNPCQVYDKDLKNFTLACTDGCVVSEFGPAVCCSDIECRANDAGPVCGNDGRSYESECALERYACRIARNISVVQGGLCPNIRSTTVVRGAIKLKDDGNCPGGCDPSHHRFQKFVRILENSMNELISGMSAEDIDARRLEEFAVVDTRNGGFILFKAAASTSTKPIGLHHRPNDEYKWVEEWLLDQALNTLMGDEKVNFEVSTIIQDKLFIEDVCLGLQCERGAVCMVTSENDELIPSCSCEKIGDVDSSPVTLSCMRASDGQSNDLRFVNENDVKMNMCSSQTFYTFQDECEEIRVNSCAAIGGCNSPGQVCMVENGQAVCRCMTCNDEDQPVCGSDGQTYRSKCELIRENCTSGGGLSLHHDGHCESDCDEVKCWYGAQCEVEAQGTLCVCPTNCQDSWSPVCASDCVTYKNECEMIVAMCEKKSNLHVIHRGTCDENALCLDDVSGEGSGEDCQCRFGATCDGTSDDEDSACVCAFSCPVTMSTDKEQLVCGEDHVTYNNACEHKKAECEQQTSISIIGNGSCADVCRLTRYGCCEDGVTSARGPAKAGCPETCQCNEHGSFGSSCEPSSGQCVCKPGVGGLKCDRCKPGYWNFRALAQGSGTGCMACRCHSVGSTRDDCDQMTGQCKCKEGVKGVKCSQCERDGSWVTSRGCANDADQATCGGRECEVGQDCVNVDEVFVCQCPKFSDCDQFQGPQICGSDGLSYPDACQMRVMACKQGVEVHAVAEGLCEAPSIEEPTTSVVIPPSTSTSTVIPSTSQSETSLPTAAPKTSPSTAAPERDHEIEASVSFDCDFDDDEDCLGSGMEEAPSMQSTTPRQVKSTTSSTLSSTSSTELVTSAVSDSISQEISSFTAMGIFKDVDGVALNYDADLSVPTSPSFQLYKELITSRVEKYLEDPFVEGKIKAIRILSFADNPHWFWGSNGIQAKMIVEHEPGADPTELLELLNKASGEIHEFSAQTDLRWTIPKFGGSSYAEFLPVDDAFSLLTIKVQFISFDEEGLLFFTTQTSSGGDFVSLAVINGFVEFRFNTGSGPLILKSAVQVSDGMWHSVVARRNRREGLLKVDRLPPMRGTSPAGSIGLDVRSSIFVGGFPTQLKSRIAEKVGVKKGLTGCIKAVLVQDYNLPMSSIHDETRISTHRLAPCRRSPCFPNPCQNAPNCSISKVLNTYTNKCACLKKLKNTLCGKADDLCKKSNNFTTTTKLQCNDISLCGLDSTAKTRSCICALERFRKRCQNVNATFPASPAFMPGFAQDSYLIRPTMGVAVKLFMQIIFVFYSSQPEGLIFYNAQRKSGRGDYIAVYLRKRHLVLQYDLGSGPAIIKTSSPISLNEWHEVSVFQRKGLGRISVDGGNPGFGESPHGHTKLNLKQPLYVGGIPPNVKTPSSLSINIGLTGALQKCIVNDRDVSLELQGNNLHYNVRPFNAHPCYHSPCLNGGSCHPQLSAYKCVCTGKWSGRHCENER